MALSGMKISFNCAKISVDPETICLLESTLPRINIMFFRNSYWENTLGKTYLLKRS